MPFRLHKFDQPILSPEGVFFSMRPLQKPAVSTVSRRDEMDRCIPAERGRVKDSIRNKRIVLSGENKSGHRDLFENMSGADTLIIVGGVQKSSMGRRIGIIERAKTSNG